MFRLYRCGIFANLWSSLIMLFAKQIEFIENFEKTIFEVLQKTINDNDFVIKDYIINKQLFREGIDGTGKKITPLKGKTQNGFYARLTIKLKKEKGDPTDRVTLRDTGEFYAHIQVDAFSDRFEISSNVSHDKKIIERYGIDVLKVTHENLSEFMQKYFIKNSKDHVDKTSK